MAESSREQPEVPRPLRILEIGDELLFKSEVPEQTDFFWTGYKPRGKIAIALGPAAFFRTVRRLRRDEYDLLALHVPLYAPWHPRVILTVLRDWRLSAPRGLFAVFGWWLIQRFHRVPMVAIDLNDSFGINRHAFRLIDASRAYFKRELPADRWQVFFKSGHANLPGFRWRKKPKNRRRLAKLRPLSYGSPNPLAPVASKEKTADVFFAGAVANNSTVRSDGIEELLALRDEGYVIDVPEGRLDMAEFHRRVAQAWLAWSPGGLGWDCSRHYEIAWLGTVPLMNYPTIVRDEPFRDGQHCVLYGAEPGELARAVRAALADKERLARMGAAAAEHGLCHHTAKARAERVAIAVLGRRLDGRTERAPREAERKWIAG
jgi:Glycosyl transferases group 1